MTKTRRIEITIETHEITRIRNAGAIETDCAECGSATQTLSAAAAAEMLGIDIGELVRMVGEGEIHGPAGSGTRTLAICGASLDAVSNTETEENGGL